MESFIIVVTGGGMLRVDPMVEASDAAGYLQDRTVPDVCRARDKNVV